MILYDTGMIQYCTIEFQTPESRQTDGQDSARLEMLGIETFYFETIFNPYILLNFETMT